MFDNVLDVFYKSIIKEAVNGKVDCFFSYNMKFNTKIVEDNVEIRSKEHDNVDDLFNPTLGIDEEVNDKKEEEFISDLFTPTLVISNKEEFNNLLIEYVDKALDFYGEERFPEEIRYSDFRYTDGGISKEKVIMTLLWSNATHEDFHDPCHFLRKRINFFELGELEKYKEEVIFGYNETLKSDIGIQIVENRLENETPYSLVINLYNQFDGEKIYEFPRIYFGISNDVGYIYAIQNHRKRFVNENYQKKIDRLMYKVDEGLDVGNDTYDNYGVGNLKDVTANAVVAVNILMGLFKNNGVSKVIVPSMLVSRWNARILFLERQRMLLYKKTLEDIAADYEKYLYLQSNLTEKFLRNFRRIGYHHSSVMVRSYPGEVSNDLELGLLDVPDVCNNKLLDETFNLENVKNKGISK